MRMNLSELIRAAESNPELKAALRKITGSPEDLAALSEVTGRKITTPGSEFRNVMKNTDIPINQEELFNPSIVRKPKVNPLPPSIIEESALPITRNEAGIPSTLQSNETLPEISVPSEPTMRDVTPPAPPNEPPVIPPQLSSAVNESGGISKAAKLGLGAAASGAALLGLQGDTENHQTETPERTPASEETISEQPKAVAPAKEKTDMNDEEETDSTDVTPSQKTQPIAKEPITETSAPQKQESIPNFLNFEKRGADQNELNKLLQQQQDEIRNQKIQEASVRIGGAFAHVTPDTEMYKEGIKLAGLPVEQYKLKQANEANDPNSGLSQGMRDYMQKLGYPVSPNSSAAHIQSVLPFIFKDVEAKQQQAAHAADLKNRLDVAQKMKETQLEQSKILNSQRKQDKQEALADKKQEKLSKEDTDRLDKLNKNITAETASSRSAFGQAARNHQSVENAKALLDGSLDPNELDTRQVYELTKTLDRVLSQAGGSVAGTEHLTPDTARSRLSKLIEFVTNKRQGAQAGSFIKTFSDTLDREQDLAKKQMFRTQKSLLGNTRDLQKRHPQEFSDILTQHGLPSDIFEQKIEEEPKRNNLSNDPRDTTALKRIMQNNPGMSIQDAAKALSDYKKNNGHP